jgi:lipid-A-disaccharide synthase
MPRLLVSCGEPSGDLYAADLLRHLRGRTPGPLDVFGLGGDRMEAEGARLLAHVRELAVVGLWEVVSHLPRFRRIFRDLLDEVDRRRPDLAVLVDYPDFNLRVARALHRRGIPVVYYVSPQVWAWRARRLFAIRDHVAHMIVIFPFEAKVYEDAGVPVTFVGHPLVDLVAPEGDRGRFLAENGLDPARPVVALLPGSRRKEIAHNLPPLAGAVRLLAQRRPELQFLAAVGPSIDPAALRAGLPPEVALVQGRTHAVLSTANVAVVASGTATVEAALLGTPMVVVYRLSPLTYHLGRRFVRVPHVAMANLIAEQGIVPELIQDEFTPETVANGVLTLLGPAGDSMRLALAEVRRRLGAPGASGRAAEVVAGILAGQKTVDSRDLP